MLRRSHAPLFAALLALGCAQQAGEVCETYGENDQGDCAEGLRCCGECAETMSRGICAASCDDISNECRADAGPMIDTDAGVDGGPGDDAGPGMDGSTGDAGPEQDAGPVQDAGTPDAGPDAGRGDGGPVFDAGAADAGPADAGPSDAGP